MRLGAAPRVNVAAYLGGSLLVLVAALFLGLLSASGFWLGQMLVAGSLVGLLLLLLPLSGLTIMLLLVTLVVQGIGTYFLHVQQAAWLPYLLCILLSLKTVRLGSTPAVGGPPPVWNNVPMVCLLLYLFSLAASAIVSRPPPGQVLIALKNALPIWVAAALVYQGAQQPNFIDRLWLTMKAVFFLQLPLVLYQHFFIAARRRDAGSTGMDAVVGSFGGLMNAGGSNSTLVLFTLLVMAFQLALWVRKQTSGWSLALYWLVGLVIIASGEVKAVLVWLPFLILYVMRRKVLASFGTALVAGLLSVVLVGGLFAAYQALYWGQLQKRDHGNLVARMTYFFDTRNINYETGEISRGAAVALWAQDRAAGPAERALGYGPGASRISATGGLGTIAKRYDPLNVSATSVSLLLWDSGLLGLLSFSGLVLSVGWALWRLAGDARLSARSSATADAFAALQFIFFSLLIYNRTLNDDPVIQLMLAMALGFALYWRNAIATQERATPRFGVAA